VWRGKASTILCAICGESGANVLPSLAFVLPILTVYRWHVCPCSPHKCDTMNIRNAVTHSSHNKSNDTVPMAHPANRVHGVRAAGEHLL
jgi:hypothetical protein